VPTWCDAAVVEERLVAEDRACDAPYAGFPHLAREVVEIEHRERRVAIALENQISVPDRSLLPTVAEDLGLDPEPGTELGECCRRHHELLDGRRAKRQIRLASVDQASVREVDDGGSGCSR
jgi:hypothetical protein